MNDYKILRTYNRNVDENTYCEERFAMEYQFSVVHL